ncbi:hypothetical protein P3S67_016948 [Capsicum chacoense]
MVSSSSPIPDPPQAYESASDIMKEENEEEVVISDASPTNNCTGLALSGRKRLRTYEEEDGNATSDANKLSNGEEEEEEEEGEKEVDGQNENQESKKGERGKNGNQENKNGEEEEAGGSLLGEADENQEENDNEEEDSRENTGGDGNVIHQNSEQNGSGNQESEGDEGDEDTGNDDNQEENDDQEEDEEEYELVIEEDDNEEEEEEEDEEQEVEDEEERRRRAAEKGKQQVSEQGGLSVTEYYVDYDADPLDVAILRSILDFKCHYGYSPHPPSLDLIYHIMTAVPHLEISREELREKIIAYKENFNKVRKLEGDNPQMDRPIDQEFFDLCMRIWGNQDDDDGLR